ncbi:SCP2 sterol-binding domain-containing protein [Alcanivorax sp. JB21]|uniref:ubiquinone biosynthesis accessory factor UbiJ n=1 Tax=Alcanivorax limicola TaxID=2874102 RepID=UPI001CBBF749|nr:SCP2 sterol-binding domain-containing protein [Alcanivorax limicola]MBZ2189284.1 SCP2 sterol-binding domain-containing protein [Alcanivorax limicola]
MTLEHQSQPPGLLETLLLASIERGVNSALRHDPASQQRLAEHSGRLISVSLRVPAREVFILIVEDGVECYHSSEAEADVSLCGGPLDLAAEFLGWDTAPGVIAGPVSVRGDRELLQALTAIARDLDVDWGALFAPLLGNELAQQVDHGARRFFHWAREGLDRLARQGSDYLSRESGLMPSRTELREFGHDVTELQMATERLEARIQRLRAQQEPRQ